MSFLLYDAPMIVHALNRGVEKRIIFMDDADRLRFVYGLYVFNTTKPVDIAALKAKGLTMSFSEERTGDPLVEIHAWCLMDNHYHLILSPLTERGISEFLRKLNIGYAKYFNDRHDRSGTLFQGRTKQIAVISDAHAMHLINYVHLNPLDYLRPAARWRTGHIGTATAALEHLGRYRWSSLNDYMSKPGFPSVISKRLYGSIFRDYKKEIRSYVAHIARNGLEKDIVSPF